MLNLLDALGTTTSCDLTPCNNDVVLFITTRMRGAFKFFTSFHKGLTSILTSM